jgi:peptidyl-dipeptidase A
MTTRILLSCLSLLFTARTFGQERPAPSTVREAEAFVKSAEDQLFDLWIKSERASWVQSTFITFDTEAMSADADRTVTAKTVELAKQSARFDGVKLPVDVERKLKLLKLSTSLPSTDDPKEQKELSEIAAWLESEYGKGKFYPNGPGGAALELSDLSRILATSRNADSLLMAWKGWRTISPPMRAKYTRLVELANKGARGLGFADLGAMWRSNYDMKPDQFAKEMNRLWEQLKPLYVSLHAYVRWKLAQHYGPSVLTGNGPIPAHLLGNMWSQEWNNIYPLVAPPAQDPGYDLTDVLQKRKFTPEQMVKSGENFFVSLGFDPLPETFWQRSMLVKPRDRDVVCHASAWDIDWEHDLRIKMCIEITEEDFTTIHHELGHNFYQRAYSSQPPLFRNSANDGFHEAIGDAIALSVTPQYLKQINLIEKVPGPEGDIGLLFHRALEKAAFLPFGLLIDTWRWQVFSGEVNPADYNKAWWALREKYQGIKSPVQRTEADFDPGAKYHVPANVPYARYFLAAVLQFQFHRAMAREAGWTGPLHRFTMYNNKVVGAKLKKMLEMGMSRPWPDALEALTGERQMDATAILEYFAPLKKWLDQQNKGHKVGW